MTFLAVVEGDAGGWRIDRDGLTEAIRAWWSRVEIDGVGLAVAQVGEGEQSLSSCVQAPPSGSESAAVFSQTGGEETQGRAGHVDAGRADKHAKPSVCQPNRQPGE